MLMFAIGARGFGFLLRPCLYFLSYFRMYSSSEIVSCSFPHCYFIAMLVNCEKERTFYILPVLSQSFSDMCPKAVTFTSVFLVV